jgi:hypothetical protein
MGTENVVSFLHRHVVPIIFIFSRSDKKFTYIVTSFVLSVGDDWFLITAGHCLQYIDDYKKEGYKISKCYLLDSSGDGATHREPVIFTYEQQNPLYIPDDRERDYGIIPLSRYYQELLRKNNIIPLSEEVWKHQPKKPEHFVLMGVPEEYIKEGKNYLELATTINYIEKCDRPDSLPDTEPSLFYGKIILSAERKSIAGMSGGPIFAFETVNEQVRYWLVALQSRWLPDSKIVVGCPTTFLGLVIEHALNNKKHR